MSEKQEEVLETQVEGQEQTEQPVEETKKPNINEDGDYVVDLSKPKTDEVKEDNADDSGVVELVEDADATEKQEEVQPEAETQEEQPALEEVTEEEVQEQTEEFQKEKKALEALVQKQETLQKNLDILKKAFSTNGLLAYKIENLVKELEELTNTYLAELSDGRFTLEFIVSNDKLNVQITDNESIVDILALSSGELARVNTATLIAIRKLMSSISKSRINILFLDEVINVLDESGREKLVEVLLQEDLNTYVVSHGWTHPLLHKIEVVKQGNVSGLEW